jgi:hypothetical protein
LHDSRSGDQPGSQYPADVPHPQSLHDRARARVVDLGKGDLAVVLVVAGLKLIFN